MTETQTQAQTQATIAYPQINISETERFAAIWKYNGLVVPLDGPSKQFATDFCNVILKQIFMSMAEAAVMTERRSAELAETEKKESKQQSTIIEA